MKKPPWRTAFYLIVLVYLVVDLKCCNGPLKRKIVETRPSSAITQENARKFGWVALVNQEPVTKKQLQLAVARYFYQRGRNQEDVQGKALTRIKRASLRRLIDDVLIRQYADGVGFEAPEAERLAFVKAWENQFHDPSELKGRSKYQDLSAEERTVQLGKIWSRKRWLEDRISPGIGITDAEIKAWFAQNKDKEDFTEPEKVRARQIFISTVEEDTEAQETLINQARQRLEKGEDFADVAKDMSEDARTRLKGGDLNWFSAKRLPEIFAKEVFSQKSNELGEPFKTEIGWHLVEVTDRQPARPLAFEHVKAEIKTHLLNQQKVEKVNELLSKLRRVANIIVFVENL